MLFGHAEKKKHFCLEYDKPTNLVLQKECKKNRPEKDRQPQRKTSNTNYE